MPKTIEWLLDKVPLVFGTSAAAKALQEGARRQNLKPVDLEIQHTPVQVFVVPTPFRYRVGCFSLYLKPHFSALNLERIRNDPDWRVPGEKPGEEVVEAESPTATERSVDYLGLLIIFLKAAQQVLDIVEKHNKRGGRA